MHLIIDQGNTKTKLAVFEQDKIIHSESLATLNDEIIASLGAKYTIKKGIIASVKTHVDQNLLKKHNIITLTHSTPLPLQLNYKTPQTLGVDRIAAAVGATTIYKNSPLLVIDIGTCVTFDFINLKNEYMGGAISLGFEMRFKALNYFTGKYTSVAKSCGSVVSGLFK